MHTTEVILFFALRFSCMHGVVEFVSTLQKGLIVLCLEEERSHLLVPCVPVCIRGLCINEGVPGVEAERSRK